MSASKGGGHISGHAGHGSRWALDLQRTEDGPALLTAGPVCESGCRCCWDPSSCWLPALFLHRQARPGDRLGRQSQARGELPDVVQHGVEAGTILGHHHALHSPAGHVSRSSISQFNDFSANTQNLLLSKNIVAMTTLTFYKIYLLCQKKSVHPEKILDLIHRHPGGVFRLEKYMKRSSQAA